MAALLLLDAMLTYGVALSYANRVHDRDLSDDALTLATMLSNDALGSELSPQARFLLEYDPNGRSYFSVRSAKRGMLTGSGRLEPPDRTWHRMPPVLYNTQTGQPRRTRGNGPADIAKRSQ
jgi:two-component system sensor histidine kinase TctE